jgi:MYXO-CTERM domain-containing protein
MRVTTLFLAAAFLTPASQAMAQSNANDEVDIIDGQQDDGDDNSKLGLLGLLGLAGLLGLKRKEPDIHIDARRDKKG